MSDARLQSLRRQGEITPALLTELMRAGRLSEDRLRLAAWCGDYAANALRMCLCGGYGRFSPPVYGPKAGRVDYSQECPSCTRHSKDGDERWLRSIYTHWSPRDAVAVVLGVCEEWYFSQKADIHTLNRRYEALYQVRRWLHDQIPVTCGTTRNPAELLAFYLRGGDWLGLMEKTPAGAAWHVYSEAARTIGADRAREAARKAGRKWALGGVV